MAGPPFLFCGLDSAGNAGCWYLGPSMVKTTLYLDEGVALKLKRMAQSQNRSQAELIRECLERLTEGRAGMLPKGLGKYESGKSDLSATYRRRLTHALRQAKGK